MKGEFKARQTTHKMRFLIGWGFIYTTFTLALPSTNLNATRQVQCYGDNVGQSAIADETQDLFTVISSVAADDTEILLTSNIRRGSRGSLGPLPYVTFTSKALTGGSIVRSVLRISYVRTFWKTDDHTNGKDLRLAGHGIIETCLRNNQNGRSILGNEGIIALTMEVEEVEDDYSAVSRNDTGTWSLGQPLHSTAAAEMQAE